MSEVRENGSSEARPDGKDPVVFCVSHDTKCEECGEELDRGSFIFLKDRKALCLSCADLDHLEFLPSGNMALTRRSRKHSTLSIVVVKWSRARKRYERQGVLVESAAREQAENECLADADLREARRVREAERRAILDQEYIAQFILEIRKQFPGCPRESAVSIGEHACRKYSGRVGRSAMAKRLDPEAVFLAVQAHVRHAHTDYDRLLSKGWDRGTARGGVEGDVAKVLECWSRPQAT